MRGSRSLLVRYKEDLKKRDGPFCFFCGERERAGDKFTLEHIVAISRGGANGIANLALAHRRCNNAAGSLSVVEKVKMRERMLAGLADD